MFRGRDGLQIFAVALHQDAEIHSIMKKQAERMALLVWRQMAVIAYGNARIKDGHPCLVWLTKSTDEYRVKK
jgi:hypothetical protein